ncbi:3-oxoacyl-ACP reductase FabG [Streptomyces sp. TRM 70351]|uniref:3-oxoacyl-ACP reductase FabG n=1 Tax=Streptomyces sp. TRM 70351 TaxID=3116552 RepID=UPI002E7BF0F5|nr:3-oxoacyl-ACP reductase FabG [Streptomyces sp. TRM 70351]MEE1930820.1 3-oxoacyl-ACP reductase FabG [Streptomyces sp. TRM 70351]
MALVTGGAKNIGRSITLGLARDGYAIAFTFLTSSDEAVRTRKEASGAGVPVLAVQCDVTSQKDVEKLRDEVRKKLGEVSVIINNAGVVRDASLHRMTDYDWFSVMAVNSDAAFRVTRCFLPDLYARRGGSVINISSISGAVGLPGQSNYSASKAALEGLTRALAKEAGRHRVRVNAVAPGFIATEFTAQYASRWRNRIPLLRFGEPEEVADLVRFLASSRAGYITGQVIRIDGGLSF